VEVYRYYCRNKLCDKGSFTHLPPGLVPYSRYRTEMHLLGVQMYAWGYSTLRAEPQDEAYRRTGTALGVANMTVYRWVSAWGYQLLPVAALFGVVKSSGVVGIDEKYVLVPKRRPELVEGNDKPEGDMRRWMYVYFAVDVYTYDLLHIAISPYNDKPSAHAFLLELRAKGYHPRVVVTDLRVDYGPLIARVFPKARHHECIPSTSSGQASTPCRTCKTTSRKSTGPVTPRPTPRPRDSSGTPVPVQASTTSSTPRPGARPRIATGR